jgi:ADP-heptose:LPS heptosyltransferase
MKGNEPGRLLVVPFADGIGDFVLMLPLLAAIRRRYPATAITVAASRRSALLLDAHEASHISIQTPSWLDRPPQPRRGLVRWLTPQKSLARLAGAALRLELGAFDQVLNLFQWWEAGMDFAAHWTPQVPARPGAVHTLDYLADRLATTLGQPISAAARRPGVTPQPGAADWAAGWWTAAGLDGQAVVGLVPASNMTIKRWPLERWAAVCDALAAAGGTPLLLLPPGPDPAERLGALTRQPPLTLHEPLDRVAAVLALCQLVIGVDTGLLHLAAAVGTRYVGLFGPTNPAMTGPYDRELGTALVAPHQKSTPCAGCWRHFKYADDRCRALAHGSCMAALAVETVIEASAVELARAQAAGDRAREPKVRTTGGEPAAQYLPG